MSDVQVMLQAKLTARSKLMLRARDVLMGICDELDDEGDRVYFGSTNHAEMLKDLAKEFDGWAWDDIMKDARKPDYIGDLYRLRLENEKLAASVVELEAKVFVPGQWRCAKCKFQLTQATLCAQSGTVHARDEAGEKCPNCNVPLWRVTEREAGNEMIDRASLAFGRLSRIAQVIERVDHRAMAADGPVTPTLKEMTQAEISEIYGLASGDELYVSHVRANMEGPL